MKCNNQLVYKSHNNDETDFMSGPSLLTSQSDATNRRSFSAVVRFTVA